MPYSLRNTRDSLTSLKCSSPRRTWRRACLGQGMAIAFRPTRASGCSGARMRSRIQAHSLGVCCLLVGR